MVTLGTIQAPRRFLRLILFLAIASFLLVVVVIYFSFSRAMVTLLPKEEPVAIEYDAVIDASKTYDPSKLDQVPGRIESVEKEGSKEITNVGEKTVPDIAHVKVTIHNEQGSAQGLLPQTQLVNADGIKFRTDAAVNVPGGSSVQVGATADAPGKEYNVGPSRFSIIKLSPELQRVVYAESKEPATGGEKTVTTVVEREITAAQDALTSELEQQAQEELGSRLQATEQFIPEAVAKKILEKTASVEPGAQTDKFSVTVKAQFATVVFDENNLLQLSIAKLNASLPETKELVSYDPGSFKYEIDSFDQKKGTAKLSAQLSGLARPRLSNDLFDKAAIKGLNRAELADHFKKFPDVDRIDVHFTPFWVLAVPTIPENITIEIGTSPSSGEGSEQKPVQN